MAYEQEEYVSYRQCLIYHQDLRINIDSDSKSQTHEHTAGICLNRLVDKISNVCEFQDIVQSGIDLLFGKSDHGTVQVYILQAGIFHIKSGSQLQQGRDTSVYLHFSLGRSQNTGDDLQDRGFTGTIGSDNTHAFPFLNIEVYITQCIMLFIKFLFGKPQSFFETI